MTNYYSKNSITYIESTLNCDMSAQYNFFEKYLLKGSTILDLGFGSGRDSLYFKNNGYITYGIDPTFEFYKKAQELGLKNIFNIKAQDIEFDSIFDGIWACASLLHVEKESLNDVFKKCSKSLKENGVMYASFKYGDFYGIKNERLFIDLTEHSILDYLLNTNLTLEDYMITYDVRPDRKNEKWLNVILRKN